MKFPASSDAVVSLFSGAGGLSFGFALAGLKPTCGAEIDLDACATYERNLGSPCFHVDLAQADPAQFADAVRGREPMFVIGGPPCQGFSTAGAKNGSDPRNRLIFNYFQLVRRLRPRWFLFENVEGLLTSGNGLAASALVRQFLEAGYSIRLQKVNLAAYGVPQTRKRVIIVGNRIGVDFEFPVERYSFESGKSKKLNLKPFAPTLNSALAGLGAPSDSREKLVPYESPEPTNEFDALMREGNGEECVKDHYHLPSKRDADLYRLLKPGQTMRDLPEKYWHESYRRRAFRRVKDGTPTEKRGGAPSGMKRLHGNLQSLTITGASTREFIHPSEPRGLTLRECARLQTFPDSYNFSGNAASVIQQIGNAVPPLAAKIFAQHILEIDGRLGSDLQAPRPARTPRLLGYVLTDSTGMSPSLQQTDSLLRQFGPGLFSI